MPEATFETTRRSRPAEAARQPRTTHTIKGFLMLEPEVAKGVVDFRVAAGLANDTEALRRLIMLGLRVARIARFFRIAREGL